MPSGKKRPPSDPAKAAKSVLDQVIGGGKVVDSGAAIAAETARVRPRFEEAAKDPAAVALGRRGGQKRAETLSEADRKRIASDAARKRWGDKKG